jgi:nitroreductase
MLEATDLGLGSVWVGMFEAGLVREKFNIPENYKIVSLLPIGYAADDSEPYNFHYKRFPLEHTYTEETY